MPTLHDVWVLPGVAHRILRHLVLHQSVVPRIEFRTCASRRSVGLRRQAGWKSAGKLLLALTVRIENLLRIDDFLADPIQTRYLCWH